MLRYRWVRCPVRAVLSLAILEAYGGCSNEPNPTPSSDAGAESGLPPTFEDAFVGETSLSDNDLTPDEGVILDSSGPGENDAAQDRTTLPDTGQSADGSLDPGDATADSRGQPDARLADGIPPLSCDPGQRLDPPDRTIECSGGFCICRGYAPDAGGLVPVVPGRGISTDVISLALPTPMQAGSSYAFSVAINNFNYAGDVELWGAKEQCGSGLERLYVERLTTKTYCAATMPSDSYTHVLFVRQLRGIADGSVASQNYSWFMACPVGACP